MFQKLFSLLKPKIKISKRDMEAMTKLEPDDCYGDFIVDSNTLLYRFPTIPNGEVQDCELRKIEFSSTFTLRKFNVEYMVDKDKNIEFYDSCDITIKK